MDMSICQCLLLAGAAFAAGISVLELYRFGRLRRCIRWIGHGRLLDGPYVVEVRWGESRRDSCDGLKLQTVRWLHAGRIYCRG